MKIGDIEFPYVDGAVQWWSVEEIQGVHVSNLETLDKVIVIESDGTPIAVMLPFERWTSIQNSLFETAKRLERAGA